MRLLTNLWLQFCAWRAERWLDIYQRRVEAAEEAHDRYRAWEHRAGPYGGV